MGKGLDRMKRAEYKWILDYIRRLPKDTMILDAGCGTGKLIRILEEEGYYNAWGLDLGKRPDSMTRIKGGKINPQKLKKEDMRKTSFEDKTFDIIFSLSTLINVGLGGYGDERDEEGDFKAMKELRRILKDSGKILITLAYGEAGVRKKRFSYRVYDDSRLELLFEGFKVLKSYYFYLEDETKTWKETKDKRKLREIFTKDIIGTKGNAYFILKKRKKKND